LLKTGFFRQVRELKYKGKIKAVLYIYCEAIIAIFGGSFFPKHMKLLTEYSCYKYFSQNDENSSPKKSLLRMWHY
jgi:hypothetical protein